MKAYKTEVQLDVGGCSVSLAELAVHPYLEFMLEATDGRQTAAVSLKPGEARAIGAALIEYARIAARRGLK